MRAQDPGRKAGAEQARRPAPPTLQQAPDAAALAAGGPSPESMATLQRAAGNAAVTRMLQLAREQHGPGCGHPQPGPPPVQRSAVHEVLSRPGQPMDASLKGEMEARLGADFSDVRLHTGDAARASATEVGARAYTSGHHVVIGEGGADKHTLAHELVHVIQQRQGPVAGTETADGLQVSDPSDRFEREAEAVASQALRGGQPDLAETPAAATGPDRGPAPVQRMERSASAAHLDLPYFDTALQQRGPHRQGVRNRFLTPTPELTEEQEQDGRPRRQITPEQAAGYERIQDQVIENEERDGDKHYPFFHAQDPRMRISQDVYKRVYAQHHGRDVPEDFHFLRYPGPEEKEFQQYENVSQFFDEDMAANGLIDDNINPTKSHIISANLSLHGGLNHSGEETFHYFQIGKGQTEIPVASFIEGFLTKFGLDSSGVAELYKKAEALNDTKEGSLFQIMVPKDIADDVAYLAHPHGLPHDDELLDDLHSLGPIRYDKPAPGTAQIIDGGVDELYESDDPRKPTPEAVKRLQKGDKPPAHYGREKMNDEITRNLIEVRELWNRDINEPSPLPEGTIPSGPGVTKDQLKAVRPQLDEHAEAGRQWRVKNQAKELHKRTLDRFHDGEYRPSRHLEDYTANPEKLRHPEFERQQQLIEKNPEHFQGQGKNSSHEMMRVANRQNFMQARVLLSESHMLNPQSGIKIIRHTTLDDDMRVKYEALLDEYVAELFRKKNTGSQQPASERSAPQ
ncbi:DUF4157 domain-containing protein [Streptomyces celluloflavus]|uniref:DUF4157 domain-containing protein n=1 Tax=Streptomyces celluloflavus TaxID=58344 RepID=UPI0037B3043D